MKDSLESILEVAQTAGRLATIICRTVLDEAPADPSSMAKGDDSPVTVADYGSQAVILKAVADAFPEHGVIAEEGSEHLRLNSGGAGAAQITRLVGDALGQEVGFEQVCDWIDHQGDSDHEFTWCIDPIDGTKGFLRRQQYAIAIGIMRLGEPWAGVMVCPNLPVDLDKPDGQRGVMYVAGSGEGCLRVPIDGGDSEMVTVSAEGDPAKWRVLGSVESAHGDPKLVTAAMESIGIHGGFVRYDSQAKYGIVAQGGAEVYVRPRSKPDYRENIWDHAAGAIVVLEAGGHITDLDGKRLDFSLGHKMTEKRGVLVTSNYAVHDAMLEGLANAEKALS